MAFFPPIVSDDGSDEMDEIGNNDNDDGQNSGQLEHDIANSLDEDKENQSHEGKKTFVPLKSLCENEKVKVLLRRV